MREYLKIKVKSLEAERRIIKTQDQRIAERLARRQHYLKTHPDKVSEETEKQSHRDIKALVGIAQHEGHLRIDARRAHLAYGFILGRDYQDMEKQVRWSNRLNDNDLKSIHAMIKKFDERDIRIVEQKWHHFEEQIKNVPIVKEIPNSRKTRVRMYHSRKITRLTSLLATAEAAISNPQQADPAA